MKTWQWKAYDTWGNQEDGWDVNDVCSCPIYILEKADAADKVWARAVSRAIFTKPVPFDLEWLDENMIEVTGRDDGFPFGRFEVVEDSAVEEKYFLTPTSDIFALYRDRVRRVA